MRSFFRRLLSLFPVLLLASCDLLSGVEMDGRFTAELTGEFTESIEGAATLDDFGFGVGPGYGITMDASNGRKIMLYTLERPRSGTYEVKKFASGSPPADGFEAAVWSEPTGVRIFQSIDGGEVRIEKSSNGLKGTFRFTATDWEEPNLTATGTFTLK